MKKYSILLAAACFLLVFGTAAMGQNLIVNGDFEETPTWPENPGFDTDYYYLNPATTGNWTMGPEGYITIGDTPRDYHSGWFDFYDHTGASGKMLIVNAACINTEGNQNPPFYPTNWNYPSNLGPITPTGEYPDVDLFYVLWSKTVDVLPNNCYEFSYWVTNSVNYELAKIECFINGVSKGIYETKTWNGEWEKISYSWKSESNDSATIVLREIVYKCDGDDFAIDDISFSLSNSHPIADANGPYLVCVEGTTNLDGSGSYDPEGDDISYLWKASNGSFDNLTLENPSYTAGTEAGIESISLTVKDECGSNTAETIVVVYDPTGGFVTGGGWINSPLKAYKADLGLFGKANFGFVAKYKKGADIPDGNTEFQFKAGDLNFHSSSYDWLVVAGAKAVFKGIGTINGEGAYKFMLTAIDSDINTEDEFDIDRFRIRIWEEDESGDEIVIYDNKTDGQETTELGGGSIVIHTK
ncbi:MAG: PKD domain-containing protein [Candidatus Omnitrophica bacterium]|nr:PKD domain-containing protein [Candidatus Omnitrophota bacterium]